MNEIIILITDNFTGRELTRRKIDMNKIGSKSILGTIARMLTHIEMKEPILKYLYTSLKQQLNLEK